MPHVHLPLQSGSDRILKAMHRTYTAEKYLALVESLRAACPDVAITTDVIVGFPGETDDDHAATRELVSGVGFDNAFVFKYSPRRDTPAATMEGAVDEPVKEERNRDILAIVDESAKRRNEALVGRRVQDDRSKLFLDDSCRSKGGHDECARPTRIIFPSTKSRQQS